MTENSKDNTPDRVIRDCHLFAKLSHASIQAMSSVAVFRDFATGDELFHQGDACPGVFIVETGAVKIFCVASGGRHHVLHLAVPGQSFAEVAVFSDFAMPASASAVEPTRCLLIPADFIQDRIATDHAFCRQMLSSMAHWTRHFTELLGDIVLRDATDRVANYLTGLPRDDDGIVDLPGPKRDIANHLDLTSETFSRTLRRLADSGKIELAANRRIRILNASSKISFD